MAGMAHCLRIAAGIALAIAAAPARAQSQRLGFPSYFSPGPLWTKLESAAPTVGIAIINPNSGPGDKLDPAYQSTVRDLKQKHITALGYVHTSYAKRDLAEVKAEVDRYYEWYGVSGIFFDEVSNTKPEIAYYAKCRDMTRAHGRKAMVVLNPGTQTDEGYMAVCDILVNFESKMPAYETEYSAPAWVTKYPASRFWHMVLEVPTDEEMRKVVAQTKERHAGWVFITTLGDPNPYDKIPEEPYWSDMLAALHSSK